MKERAKILWAYIRQTFREFGNDGGTSMAAAIAYYTIFALPPLLVLVVVVTGLIVDPHDVRELLAGEIGGLTGSVGQEEIGQMIDLAREQATGKGIGAIVGGVVLLMGAAGAFIELQDALNRAWGVMPDPEQGGVKSFLLKRFLSLGMVLGVVFLLLVSLIVSTFISAVGEWIEQIIPGLSVGVLWLIDLALSLLIIGFLIGGIFKVLPDAELSWNDVRAGTIVTAVLFLIGKFAIGFYLGRSDVGSVFGAAGSLAVLLTWIYYSAIIFLLGAEFTQVWVQQHGRQILPEPGAVKVRKVLHVRRRKASGREEEETIPADSVEEDA